MARRMTARSIALAVLIPLVSAACAGAAAVPSIEGPGERDGGELDERVSDEGGVAVAATWVASAPPTLQLSMDTHSVDLDLADLADLARVRLDGGGWTRPSAVDIPLGGHHREGTLLFAPLGPSFGAARVIELEIRDVAVPVRIIRWERGS